MHGVNGLQGGGPWRIEPDCPARVHNSLRAALGWGSGRKTREKCICLRGQDLLALERIQRNERKKKARDAVKWVKSEAKLEHLKPEETEATPPDFAGGLCTSPAGMKIADGGQNDQASRLGIAERAAAKRLCDVCPLKPMCREWVLSQERPAGTWGGVWGGLDPWNRKGLEVVIRDGRAGVIPYVIA